MPQGKSLHLYACIAQVRSCVRVYTEIRFADMLPESAGGCLYMDQFANLDGEQSNIYGDISKCQSASNQVSTAAKGRLQVLHSMLNALCIL